ncbi:holin [Acinetobacter guillouiae]|uniref:holin n=1 Tax=Acinetobacter guillouiae TaxID=106649 RepID=UPI0028E5641B|nr:holin [Acinetobacter guillouiae]
MADNQQIVEASTGVVAGKVITYSGSAGGALAWFASLDIAFWISILIAIAGLIMNWYFARKKDKRDELEHKAYIASLQIKGQIDVKQD